eukprot:gene4324-4603_t
MTARDPHTAGPPLPCEPSATKHDDSSAPKPLTDRKAAKKAAKAFKRAQREGAGPVPGSKPCSMCHRDVDLLIRCTYDASGSWKMVCGKCWHVASGGVVDGDKDHPYY